MKNVSKKVVINNTTPIPVNYVGLVRVENRFDYRVVLIITFDNVIVHLTTCTIDEIFRSLRDFNYRSDEAGELCKLLKEVERSDEYRRTENDIKMAIGQAKAEELRNQFKALESLEF